MNMILVRLRDRAHHLCFHHFRVDNVGDGIGFGFVWFEFELMADQLGAAGTLREPNFDRI